eukprot:937169-Pelagomonas_calceolata.AAC.5
MIPVVGRRLLHQLAAAEATTLLPVTASRAYTTPSVQQQAEAATQAVAAAPRIVLQQQGEEGVSSSSSTTPTTSNSRPRWLEQLGGQQKQALLRMNVIVGDWKHQAESSPIKARMTLSTHGVQAGGDCRGVPHTYPGPCI